MKLFSDLTDLPLSVASAATSWWRPLSCGLVCLHGVLQEQLLSALVEVTSDFMAAPRCAVHTRAKQSSARLYRIILQHVALNFYFFTFIFMFRKEDM